MPRKLTAAEVDQALGGLPGWSGDTGRLRRSVRLPAATVDAVLADVAAAADGMNHHPVVDRSGDEVGFDVWTHSVGGVTELDVTLARRIEDVLAAAPGGGATTSSPDIG